MSTSQKKENALSSEAVKVWFKLILLIVEIGLVVFFVVVDVVGFIFSWTEVVVGTVVAFCSLFFSSSFQIAVRVISLTIGVLKSNFVPFNCHSTNINPTFSGTIGWITNSFSTISCSVTEDPPSLLNITLKVISSFSSFNSLITSSS